MKKLNKRHLLILFSILFIVVCSAVVVYMQRPRSVSYNLTDGNYKYWYTEEYDTFPRLDDKEFRNWHYQKYGTVTYPEVDRIRFYYYFDTSGKWIIFDRDNPEDKFEEYNGYDDIYEKKWKLTSDSTIHLGMKDYDYKIVSIEKDTIVLMYPVLDGVIKLITARDIPKEFQRRW